MKNALLALTFIFLVQFTFGQSDKIATEVITTEISCDHCAVCESCDQNIFMKIKENAKGIRSIKIDAEKNTITVKFNPKKTNLEEIEKAITLSGYKANEHEPTAEAYDKLDGCCKKR